jgi:DNA primase
VVVESPMSVAKAVTLGIPNVCATFGAKVTQHQIDLLKPFGTVTVWFDNDNAGRSGERKLVDGLYRHTDVRVVTPDFRDLGDYTDANEVVTTILGARPAVLALAERNT